MIATAVIYNPRAGKLRGKGPAILDGIGRALGGATFLPTAGPRTAGGIARRAIEEGAQRVLVAGGDGTINEALEGVAGSPAILGVLPLGTANVLATELGLPRDPEAAAASLARCTPHRVSIGRLTSTAGARHFLLMAGAGLDAHIVYHLSLPLKDRLGKGAYWIAGFAMATRRLEEFEAVVDGERARASFALVSKVRNYGGDLEIARDVSLLDDRFEVVLFEGRNTLRYLKYLAGVATHRVAGLRGVTVRRAQRVELCCASGQRVYVQIDGESAGCLPATIEMVPNAITLLIPDSYRRL